MKLQQLLVVQAEHKLETVLFGVRVPMRPVPIASVVRLILNLSCGDAECNSLVWLSRHLNERMVQKHSLTQNEHRTHDEILICFVRGLPLLLPRAHEPPPRDDTWLYLWQMHLHHHSLLARIPIPDLRHSVSWPADLQEDFTLHT